MATWDLQAIAAALGGTVRNRKPHVHDVQITHPVLGTRLKLDMAPEYDAVRMWCDRNDNGHLILLGRIDLFDIADIAILDEQGVVRFTAHLPRPSCLEVTSDATFLLSVGDPPDHDSQANGVASAPVDEEGLVHLVGRLARPHYSESSGKPFFTAGLAEHPDGAIAPVWHNLKGFGGVARQAKHLERGVWVRLTGKPYQDRYSKGGVEHTQSVILLIHIEATDQT